MVDRDNPTDNCGCDDKKPCVLIFSNNTDDKGNKKREHSDTLVPTENAWLEKHDVAKEHATEECDNSLDKCQVKGVVDDELF